ncbi:MurR/RpiR family transcriptional regulator [Enterococcus asini]|uniref:MurR/RpiR family transcriptional regulator n=2 Tax=Enterococcus asini TaxID=57732 RepID=UPI002892BBED|nr:MurR/RpiR family transcriptional regulator [Enterococcus asini]
MNEKDGISMNSNLLGRIESLLDELNKSERKIGNYILANSAAVIKMTASQLAQQSQTSPATVIRFCRSIGIESFTDLKLQLSAEYQHPNHGKYSDIDSTESISELKSKLLGNSIQAMEETVQLLDERTVIRVCDEIRKADVLYIYGIGSSSLVAEDISQKWSRIGKECLVVKDVHIFLANMSSSSKKGVFLAISNSGDTPEIIRLTKFLAKQGITTMGLTQLGSNALSKVVDITIHTVRSKEAIIRSGATSSLMAQLITIDVLFFAYLLTDYEKNMEDIHRSRKIIQEYQKGM